MRQTGGRDAVHGHEPRGRLPMRRVEGAAEEDGPLLKDERHDADADSARRERRVPPAQLPGSQIERRGTFARLAVHRPERARDVQRGRVARHGPDGAADLWVPGNDDSSGIDAQEPLRSAGADTERARHGPPPIAERVHGGDGPGQGRRTRDERSRRGVERGQRARRGPDVVDAAQVQQMSVACGGRHADGPPDVEGGRHGERLCNGSSARGEDGPEDQPDPDDVGHAADPYHSSA